MPGVQGTSAYRGRGLDVLRRRLLRLLVYLVLQRQFINGITAGAIKS